MTLSSEELECDSLEEEVEQLEEQLEGGLVFTAQERVPERRGA